MDIRVLAATCVCLSSENAKQEVTCFKEFCFTVIGLENQINKDTALFFQVLVSSCWEIDGSRGNSHISADVGTRVTELQIASKYMYPGQRSVMQISLN